MRTGPLALPLPSALGAHDNVCLVLSFDGKRFVKDVDTRVETRCFRHARCHRDIRGRPAVYTRQTNFVMRPMGWRTDANPLTAMPRAPGGPFTNIEELESPSSLLSLGAQASRETSDITLGGARYVVAVRLRDVAASVGCRRHLRARRPVTCAVDAAECSESVACAVDAPQRPTQLAADAVLADESSDSGGHGSAP